MQQRVSSHAAALAMVVPLSAAQPKSVRIVRCVLPTVIERGMCISLHVFTSLCKMLRKSAASGDTRSLARYAANVAINCSVCTSQVSLLLSSAASLRSFMRP
jgi:hypothetical protein